MVTLHYVRYDPTKARSKRPTPTRDGHRLAPVGDHVRPVKRGVAGASGDPAGTHCPRRDRDRRPRSGGLRLREVDPDAGRIHAAHAPGRARHRLRDDRGDFLRRRPAHPSRVHSRHPRGRAVGTDDVRLVHLDGVDVAVLPMKNRLRVLRAEYNWSQMELGLRVGVSRQAINAIETGKYDPSLPLAMKLARLFEKRVEEVFQLEETD